MVEEIIKDKNQVLSGYIIGSMKLDVEWDFTPNLLFKIVSIYAYVFKVVYKDQKFIWPDKSYLELLFFCWTGIFIGKFLAIDIFLNPEFGLLGLIFFTPFAIMIMFCLGIAALRTIQLLKVVLDSIYYTLWLVDND